MTHGCTARLGTLRLHCPEEPFLHALLDEENGAGETSIFCTKHVKFLKKDPPLVHNGVPQVHEVTPACLEDRSVWDMDENCCILPELDEDPALVEQDEKPLVYSGGGAWRSNILT